MRIARIINVILIFINALNYIIFLIGYMIFIVYINIKLIFDDQNNHYQFFDIFIQDIIWLIITFLLLKFIYNLLYRSIIRYNYIEDRLVITIIDF